MLTVSKLSRQERAILECLYEADPDGKGVVADGRWRNIGTVSWFVAERFNRQNKDRVWDDHKHKTDQLEGYRRESKDLFDEKGNFKDEAAREKGTNLYRATILAFELLDAVHRKKRRLTAKHRASFSRSIKRLKERGLIECYVNFKLENREGKWWWIWYTGNGRTHYIELTEEGLRTATQILPLRGPSLPGTH